MVEECKVDFLRVFFHSFWNSRRDTSPIETNHLSERIIGAAIEVHRELGPGLLESVYELCLMEELRNRKLHAENRLSLPVVYKGRPLDKELIVDIMVENTVILELKAVEGILPVHQAQLLSYLRLTQKPLGLLMNFHVSIMTKGLTRIVNDRVDIVADSAAGMARKQARGDCVPSLSSQSPKFLCVSVSLC